MKSFNRIVIDFIPQSEQRYDTCGDWFYNGKTLVLKISRTSDMRHHQLVAVHELVEALLCNVDGVTQEQVDAFDMGIGGDLDEPGNDLMCPCHAQHMIASAVERVVASAMRVDWAEYEQAVQDHGVK